MLALVLSTALILLDARTPYGNTIRYPFSFVTGIVQFIAYIPSAFTEYVSEQARTRANLRDENRHLQRQQLILQQKVQRLAVLEAENVRLRELLNSSEQLQAGVLVAEIIGTDPDPNRQELLINKGSGSGVYEGQAVLDAHGLVGQVVEVQAFTSRVLLLTDHSHALSVQVNRNGIRMLAAGTGQPDQMQLLYVPGTADIRKGDLLVSTGLGQRFPRGYPVAIVSQVSYTPGQDYARVLARPAADVDRASHVMLVLNESSELQQSLRENTQARQAGMTDSESKDSLGADAAPEAEGQQ